MFKAFIHNIKAERVEMENLNHKTIKCGVSRRTSCKFMIHFSQFRERARQVNFLCLEVMSDRYKYTIHFSCHLLWIYTSVYVEKLLQLFSDSFMSPFQLHSLLTFLSIFHINTAGATTEIIVGEKKYFCSHNLKVTME